MSCSELTNQSIDVSNNRRLFVLGVGLGHVCLNSLSEESTEAVIEDK